MTLRSATAIVVVMAMGACTVTDPATPINLAGTAWQATRLSDGSAVADPARLTVAFDAEGRAAIRADCNRGSGAWRSPAPGQLAFGAVATTRMACLGPSQGDRFLADLAATRLYRIEDGRLVLEADAGTGPLVLQPQPQPR